VRNIRRPKVLAVVVAAIIFVLNLLIFALARPKSVLYMLPVALGPLAGTISIVLFTAFINRTPLRTQLYPMRPTYALFVIVGSYVALVTVFALSYTAAIEFEGQILSAESNYKCLVELEHPPARKFGLLLYYSLVTASTLGYGDWVPTGITPRLLVFLQVVQFWVLVLVSVAYFQLVVGEAREKLTAESFSSYATP